MSTTPDSIGAGEPGSDLFERWLAHRENQPSTRPDPAVGEPAPADHPARRHVMRSAPVIAPEPPPTPVDATAPTPSPPAPPAPAAPTAPTATTTRATRSTERRRRPARTSSDPDRAAVLALLAAAPAQTLAAAAPPPVEPATPATPATPVTSAPPPAEAGKAGDPAPAEQSAQTPPPPADVRFRPRFAAYALTGLLVLAGAVATVRAAPTAWETRTPGDLGLVALLAFATAVAAAVWTSTTPARLAVSGSVLVVRLGGGRYVFDLDDPGTQVTVVGRPGLPGWQVRLTRRNRPPFVVDASMVRAERFMQVLREHRPAS